MDLRKVSGIFKVIVIKDKKVLFLMKIVYSNHWLRKRKDRPEIRGYMIRYCIQNSKKLRDRYQKGVWNALSRIPSSGRMLKVAYKFKGKTIKILTAYWLE